MGFAVRAESVPCHSSSHGHTLTLSSSIAESGRMMGRNDSECGQMGVNSMQGTLG